MSIIENNQFELDRDQYAAIGMILTFVGGAESVTGRIWSVLANGVGRGVDAAKVARSPMSDKLRAVRDLIGSDGSAADHHFTEIERLYEALALDRHTLAHGFSASTVDGPCIVNFKNRHTVWAADLEKILALALDLRRLCFEMAVQAAQGNLKPSHRE